MSFSGAGTVLRRRSSELLALGFGLTTAWLLLGRVDRGFDFDESVAVGTVISRGSATVPLLETHVYNNHPLFAVIQSVWWAAGGVGESRQRLLPILYGVAAVVLLVWWVGRRWGAAPAVAAGAVLMLNPMFVSQARLVRGYSLAVLGLIVSTLALMEYLGGRGRSGSSDRRLAWLLVAHGTGAVVAVGTHAFFAVPLGAIGVGVVVGRLADHRLRRTWAVSIAAVAVLYLPTVVELVSTTASRAAPDRPWFGRLLVWELLGRDRLTAIVVGIVALIGVVATTWSLRVDRSGDRPHLRTGRFQVAALAALAAASFTAWLVWQVVPPPDLLPRFFLGFVPLVAILVARATRLLPVLVGVVVIAQLFSLGNVLDVRQRAVPIREVANVIDGARGLSLTPCVIGSEALGAYTPPTVEFVVDEGRYEDQFVHCDVLVQVGTWGRVVRADADEAYPYSIDFGGGIRGWSVVPADELAAA